MSLHLRLSWLMHGNAVISLTYVIFRDSYRMLHLGIIIASVLLPLSRLPLPTLPTA